MSVHQTWRSVLEQLKREDPKENNFYMFCQFKGTKHEMRSRFLSLSEAIQHASNEIQRGK